MLILDENDKPIIIEDIEVPLLSDYFWVLDLNIREYTLSPILFLEEVVCPTLTLEIFGFRFNVPANWHILIYSGETSQLDIVNISHLSGGNFTALLYGPHEPYPRPGKLKVVDYQPRLSNCTPTLNKHEMLCHPIGPDEWINISPSDSYNKYLKELLVGDIV